MIGSAGCGLSKNAGMMIGWRIVQALGACASVALSRAMVRDLYEGSRAAKMLSTLITVMAVTPLIGPLLGGQIAAFADGTPWPMAWGILICGICCLLSMGLLIPRSLSMDLVPISVRSS